MRKQKEASEWRRTACIMAMIHNVNCKKGKEKSPDEFMPDIFEEAEGEKMSEKEVRKGYRAIKYGWEEEVDPREITK